ncbi:MFS transporter [Paenibacillus sp. URB8-2]|uniref:MFS transporter n=1 Tax=Paenibacillus sp. URB8-2 TaxID=2741301 RepID=UPI0015BC73CA|nr:MFS transporter [Paenibacillus sp. URB8-2]BCG57211.1 putative MFS-type transporter YfiS [Paenibacillus sp. URB8-2]
MKDRSNPNEQKSKLKLGRPLTLLLSAQLVSNVGDWLHVLALLTMVGLKWNATPWEITAISLCMAAPMLLGGPFAGVAADRLNRKALMIGSDVVRAVIVASLVFAGSLTQVYVLLLLKGTMDVIFSPAKSGKLKELVPASQMDAAVSLSSSIEQITKIIGPALGGLLVAMFGISVCYLIDAATFLVSAAILVALPRGRRLESEDRAEGRPGNRPSFRSEMATGLRMIAGMPAVLSGILMLVSVLLVLNIADSQLVTLFRIIPGVSGDLLGWCVGASGLGTLIAALLVGRMGSSRPPLLFMGLGAVLMGAVFAGAAVATAYGEPGAVIYIILFSAFLLAGAGAGLVFIPFQSMLQKRTPEAYTGRVFGTVNSLASASVILGPVAGGALVTASGPVAAFIVSGLLTLLLGAAMLTLRGYIDRRDQAAGAGTAGENAAAY